MRYFIILVLIILSKNLSGQEILFSENAEDFLYPGVFNKITIGIQDTTCAGSCDFSLYSDEAKIIKINCFNYLVRPLFDTGFLAIQIRKPNVIDTVFFLLNRLPGIDIVTHRKLSQHRITKSEDLAFDSVSAEINLINGRYTLKIKEFDFNLLSGDSSLITFHCLGNRLSESQISILKSLLNKIKNGSFLFENVHAMDFDGSEFFVAKYKLDFSID